MVVGAREESVIAVARTIGDLDRVGDADAEAVVAQPGDDLEMIADFDLILRVKGEELDIRSALSVEAREGKGRDRQRIAERQDDLIVVAPGKEACFVKAVEVFQKYELAS